MPSEATQSMRPNAPGAAAEPRLPQTKAEVLRDQMLATPGLSSLDAEAMLTVFAAALLAESEDRYSREAALGILQRARKISPEMLAAAVDKLTERLAGAMTEFWSRFIQETWQSQDPPPQYVDPGIVAKRKELEEQEQERNRELAAQYVDNAKVAVAALGIGEKESPQNQVPTEKARLETRRRQSDSRPDLQTSSDEKRSGLERRPQLAHPAASRPAGRRCHGL